MLERQARFRLAADVVTEAFTHFPEVEAVALIGSVARPLWREVPRFSPFRQQRAEICASLAEAGCALQSSDPLVWLKSLNHVK